MQVSTTYSCSNLLQVLHPPLSLSLYIWKMGVIIPIYKIAVRTKWNNSFSDSIGPHSRLWTYQLVSWDIVGLWLSTIHLSPATDVSRLRLESVSNPGSAYCNIYQNEMVTWALSWGRGIDPLLLGESHKEGRLNDVVLVIWGPPPKLKPLWLLLVMPLWTGLWRRLPAREVMDRESGIQSRPHGISPTSRTPWNPSCSNSSGPVGTWHR